MAEDWVIFQETEKIRSGIVTDKRCHCWLGWQCEDHPHKPWEHDNCGAAGDRCNNPNCPYKERQRLGQVRAKAKRTKRKARLA